MNMKKYERAQLEIIELAADDIVTASEDRTKILKSKSGAAEPSGILTDPFKEIM